ncbi:hypothetical protein EX30DRAFT_180361 [Ascodesmis nigricans]|uniref:Uncharacterized protein n=1 Tax=Ascodesmis nigricans TaxID=341454 RepID=A0A4V3SHV3_9PEZI|nr:hypothetical protein EX30DRAFT_180361 [Ascodesmis nigricans]
MRSPFRSNPPPPPPDPPPPSSTRRNSRRARARESWHLTKLPSIRRHLYLLAFAVLLLMSMIALYLGLFLTLGPKLTKTYHVFLVIVIALAALFVGYAVVRVYCAVEKERKLRRGEKGRVPVEERRRRRREESYQPPPTPRTVAYGEYGYAVEGEGVEEHYQPGSQARPPPPVYGQWRQS